MTQYRKPAWSLNPAEVSTSVRATNVSGRREATRSRAADLTEATITIRHEPTGIAVGGVVPPGHYTRTRMGQLKDQLHRWLFAELERLVAQRLRVPGR